ncbi:MAG: septum formation initiator family protein [Desulfomonilaceae bacterium]
MRVTQWKKLETGSTTEGGPKSKQTESSDEKTIFHPLLGMLPYGLTVLLLILLLVGFFNVWTRMGLVQLGYKISKLETKNKELKSRVRELSLELASLESPAEIEKRATKQGLKMPLVGRIVNVP